MGNASSTGKTAQGIKQVLREHTGEWLTIFELTTLYNKQFRAPFGHKPSPEKTISELLEALWQLARFENGGDESKSSYERRKSSSGQRLQYRHVERIPVNLPEFPSDHLWLADRDSVHVIMCDRVLNPKEKNQVVFNDDLFRLIDLLALIRVTSYTKTPPEEWIRVWAPNSEAPIEERARAMKAEILTNSERAASLHPTKLSMMQHIAELLRATAKSYSSMVDFSTKG